jgi:hypothetical protein
MPSYDEELQALLGVPSFGPLARATERVVEVLFKPSFHPECALRAEMGREGALLSARTLRRSFWNHWNVSRGGRGPNPVLDRLEPAVAAEEWIVTGEPLLLLHSLLDPWRSFHDPASSAGLDGLVAEVWLRDRAGAESRWSLWIGEPIQGCGRLVAGALRVALDQVQGEMIRANLAATARYFPK